MKIVGVATGLVLAVVFTLTGVCEEQRVVEADKLVERGGLRYEINSETPYRMGKRDITKAYPFDKMFQDILDKAMSEEGYVIEELGSGNYNVEKNS